MKKEKSTTNSNDETGNENSFDALLTNLDIDIANLEKTGLFFILYGYSIFVVGANLDILESLDINDTGYVPDTVTLYGQELVLTGYIILFIVASKRVSEKGFRDSVTDEDYDLGPYSLLANAYLLSVLANSLRVVAFSQIDTVVRKNREK